MTTTHKILVGTAGLLLLTTACAGPREGAPDQLSAPPPGLSRVVLLGDSVAKGQGVALSAAFDASGVEFSSQASEGGGNVVGPGSEEQWEARTELLSTARPSTVIYQITTYDWGTDQEQRAGYERLLDDVRKVGGKLVFVTVPPIRPDEFYAPHVPELERTTEVARQVADESEGDAVLLDAGAVWGEEFQQERDGTADRSADGIHTCPQGAARFSTWLLDQLQAAYPAFTPAEPADWANTGWADDAQFIGC